MSAIRTMRALRAVLAILKDKVTTTAKGRLLRGGVTFLLLAVSAGSVQAQTPDEELALLRQFLNIPASTALVPSAVPRLPNTRPINVYVATGLDMGVRQNFFRWIEEWNRRDGKKHGQVTLVSEPALADVVLARYVDRDKAQTAINSRLGSGMVYDPATQKVHAAPYAQQYSYSAVPVFAYVLAQNSPSHFEIVWRYAETTVPGEYKDSGKALWDDFTKLMKNRTERR
jgi:hypothetical protein